MQFLLLHKDAADFKMLTYQLSELVQSTKPCRYKINDSLTIWCMFTIDACKG